MDLNKRKTSYTLQFILLGILLMTELMRFGEMDFAAPYYFLSAAYPKTESMTGYAKTLEATIYAISGVKLSSPITLLTSTMPGTHQKQSFSHQLADIKGYFEQDENTHLSQEEAQAQAASSVKQQGEQDTQTAPNIPQVDFKNQEDVYCHYFTASGGMDFGMDMLENWDFDSLRQKQIVLREEDGPQILIFHTHAREDFIGGQTVVDLAEELKTYLEDTYGVRVLHVKDEFYEASNQTKYVTRGEYERMEPVIEEVLKKYPSISVVMDIHRDGVREDVHLVTDIDGKPTAQIMFVNGLCLNRNLEGKVEPKVDLPNPYLADNLAFSLQSKMAMEALYPGLSRKIFLNEWRYSTHMCPQSLLVEWGADTNTWEEAKNGVKPFGDVLMHVLKREPVKNIVSKD